MAVAIRETLPELFGSVRNALIEEFDWQYAAVVQATTVAATVAIIIAGLQRDGVM